MDFWVVMPSSFTGTFQGNPVPPPLGYVATLYARPVKQHPWTSIRACSCVFRTVVLSSTWLYCCFKVRYIILGCSVSRYCGIRPQISIVSLFALVCE
jgi:hypothetical protein